MDDHIGYLRNGEVSCANCYVKRNDGKFAAALYKINVYPYKQTCHTCGKILVEPKTDLWCELFPKKSE